MRDPHVLRPNGASLEPRVSEVLEVGQAWPDGGRMTRAELERRAQLDRLDDIIGWVAIGACVGAMLAALLF